MAAVVEAQAGKPGRKRTNDKCAADRALIAHWHAQKQTQFWMAEKLGLSQGQISYDLKIVRQAWRQMFLRDYDDHMAGIIATIDAVEAEAWRAWELSLQSQERTVMQSMMGDDGKTPVPVGHTSERVPGTGDPVWPGIVLECVKLRLDIIWRGAPGSKVPNAIVAGYVTATTPDRWSRVADDLGELFKHMANRAVAGDPVMGEIIDVTPDVETSASPGPESPDEPAA